MISPEMIEPDQLPDYPLRKAFMIFYESYSQNHDVPEVQQKAAECISRCKTGELGYTVSFCPECGYKKMRPRSCNNRNCSCCQAPLEQKWIMERNSELIYGTAYYHVVFTVPDKLNDLFRTNQKSMYDLLFSAASDTLIALCRDKKYMGATPGIVLVLHTWGQRLNFHPHLHVMLTGGGLTESGQFIQTRHKGFIIPKEVLGRVFRGKFLSGLKSLRESDAIAFEGRSRQLMNPVRWKTFLDDLYSNPWIPFIKETFNGNGNAIRYLARYSYRTAISNSRIIDVTDSSVTISYTDYADGNAKKLLRFKGEDFIGNFLMHVPPKGFHRVRFSGFQSNCVKSKSLSHMGRLMRTPYQGSPTKGKKMSELLMMIYGTDVCRCPNCRRELQTYFYVRAPDAP